MQEYNVDPVAPTITDPPFEAYSRFEELERKMETYLLHKAPFKLPEVARGWLVRLLPWIAVFFIIVCIPLLLGLFGLYTLMLPFAAASAGPFGVAADYVIALATTVPTIVFFVMAVPHLFKRTKRGWTYLFYGTLLSFAGSLLQLHIVGAAVWGLFHSYFLFQVKYLYRA